MLSATSMDTTLSHFNLILRALRNGRQMVTKTPRSFIFAAMAWPSALHKIGVMLDMGRSFKLVAVTWICMMSTSVQFFIY
jgi:hypothetical protein